MIRTLSLRNFKGLREVDLDLKPFNVLIGPNDTGKSSILQALRLYSRLLTVPLSDDAGHPWKAELATLVNAQSTVPGICFRVATADIEHAVDLRRAPLLPPETPLYFEEVRDSAAGIVRVDWSPGARVWQPTPELRFVAEDANWGSRLLAEGVGCAGLAIEAWEPDAILGRPTGSEPFDLVRTELLRSMLDAPLRSHVQASTAQLYRLRVDRLAEPAPLVPGKHPGLAEDGFGLASYLYDLRDRADGTIEQIEKGLRARLPGFERLQYSRVPLDDGQLGALVRFKWAGMDPAVSAAHTSDGALLFLAYLTIAHSPDNPAILLIEEPENGIHAAALKEVVADLKGLTEGKWGNPPVQVLLTTHSSLLVDWAEPEELIVCQRRKADGQIAVGKIPDPDQLRAKLQHIGLGELWDTVGEEGLVP